MPVVLQSQCGAKQCSDRAAGNEIGLDANLIKRLKNHDVSQSARSTATKCKSNCGVSCHRCTNIRHSLVHSGGLRLRPQYGYSTCTLEWQYGGQSELSLQVNQWLQLFATVKIERSRWRPKPLIKTSQEREAMAVWLTMSHDFGFLLLPGERTDQRDGVYYALWDTFNEHDISIRFP